MKKNIILLATLLIATLITGCQKVDEGEIQPRPEKEDNPAGEVWKITIKAVKTDGAETKGMAIGDGENEGNTETLKSIWKANETVQVYLGTNHIGYLTAVPDSEDAHKATLSGTVTTTNLVVNESKLTLITPGTRYGGEPEAFTWDYTGQTGVLLEANNSIEKMYHYTAAIDVLVTEVDGEHGTFTTGTAMFTNQQSIYRLSFRFQKPDESKIAINAKTVTITSAGGHLVQSQAVDGKSQVEGPISVSLATATTNPFFVALRNGDQTKAEALTFTVFDSEGATYKGSKTVPAEYKANGTFVSIKNATLDRLGVPLSESTSATAW